MKYNKEPRIWGTNKRTKKDSVRRVAFNRSGVRVDTRKGKSIVWFIGRPFSVLRLV
jgi:hypothetical protein